MKAILSINVSERPREKIINRGVRSLSDDELLAVILGSGSKQRGVHLLTAQVRKVIDLRNGELTRDDLTQISGIGTAKATLLLAALEFSRRRIRPEGTKITKPGDVLPLLQHWAARKQEHFLSVTLNGAHEVIKVRVITVGLLNSSQVHPREVFSDALTDRACAIIVAHNHPSGDCSPSQADREVTSRLRESGCLLGITMLDHIIFSQKDAYSLQEERRISPSAKL